MSRSIHAPPRLMPDPYPYGRIGILTPGEFEAVKRVLRAARDRPQALCIMEWSRDDQDASIALSRFGYTCTMPDGGSFWLRFSLTESGAAYLAQIEDES